MASVNLGALRPGEHAVPAIGTFITMIPTVNRRPGKLWAVVQFPLSRIVIAALMFIAWQVVFQTGERLLHVPPQGLWGLAADAAYIAGLFAIYTTFVRVFERRAAVELTRSGAAAELGTGALCGAVLFGISMLVLHLFGVWSATGTSDWSVFVYPLAGAVVAACGEELLVRGVLFRIIEESLGSWVALGLSAAIFGLLHAFNHGATAVSTAAIALEAGVLLAAAFMYSRRLWLVIGLHAGWNFTEGGIFGASVSGGHSRGLMNVQFHGPAILTGGDFGPEASVVAVIVCLIAGVWFVVLARRNGRVVRPFWRRQGVAR